MLADHDWLINERGVATVEPSDGALALPNLALNVPDFEFTPAGTVADPVARLRDASSL